MGLGVDVILLRQDVPPSHTFHYKRRASRTGELLHCAAAVGSCTSLLPALLENRLPSSEGESAIQELLRGNPSYDHDPSHYAYVRPSIQYSSEGSATAFMSDAQQSWGSPMPRELLKPTLSTGNCLTISASLRTPISSGNIHISSSNLSAKPKINPSYLSHPLDVEVLARHLAHITTVAKAEPPAPYIKPNGR